jgi:hypothetical protein
MTFEEVARLAIGTRVLYHRLTTRHGIVVRQPITVYYAGCRGLKRVAVVWPGVGERAVDPRWLELPEGLPVVDEQVIKILGKKREETK